MATSRLRAIVAAGGALGACCSADRDQALALASRRNRQSACCGALVSAPRRFARAGDIDLLVAVIGEVNGLARDQEFAAAIFVHARAGRKGSLGKSVADRPSARPRRSSAVRPASGRDLAPVDGLRRSACRPPKRRLPRAAIAGVTGDGQMSEGGVQLGACRRGHGGRGRKAWLNSRQPRLKKFASGGPDTAQIRLCTAKLGQLCCPLWWRLGPSTAAAACAGRHRALDDRIWGKISRLDRGRPCRTAQPVRSGRRGQVRQIGGGPTEPAASAPRARLASLPAQFGDGAGCLRADAPAALVEADLSWKA